MNRVERAIFEISRLVAGLAAVDGAVVLSKRFDLIGFGAEVSGELPYPDTVWEALDVEAERRAPEAANSVGTRHRAAYRFVTAHPWGSLSSSSRRRRALRREPRGQGRVLGSVPELVARSRVAARYASGM